MALLRLPPAGARPVQGREGRHAEGRGARPGLPRAIEGAHHRQDLRAGPGAARVGRRVPQAGARGRALLRVRRLHHGGARVPDAQAHHPGAGRHDGQPGGAVHAQAKGREPLPRGHLRHHAAHGRGAQPVARVGAQPHGLAVAIEVACPLGGRGGRGAGRRRRRPPQLQDRRRARAQRAAAAQHGLAGHGRYDTGDGGIRCCLPSLITETFPSTVGTTVGGKESMR